MGGWVGGWVGGWWMSLNERATEQPQSHSWHQRYVKKKSIPSHQILQITPIVEQKMYFNVSDLDAPGALILCSYKDISVL